MEKNIDMSREEKMKKHYKEFSSGQSKHVEALIDKYDLTPVELLEMKRKYCRHLFRYNPDKEKYYCIKCLLLVDIK